MRNQVLFATLILTFVFGALAVAQVPDPGIPDTIRVNSITLPSGTTEFNLQIYLYNDEELAGGSIPIKWDSPDITCDTVIFDGSRINYVNNKLYTIDNDNQRLQAGFVIFFETYVQAGSGLFYTAHFNVAPGASNQVITFDSTFYPPGGDFVLTLANANNIVPQMAQGTVTLGELSPSISVDPASFDFSATAGGANPVDQILTVDNAGSNTLNWTVSDDADWLTLDPTSGTDFGEVTLSVDITGLIADTYNATITVSDPAADNDPVTVPVTLTVNPGPPCLSLSTNALNFSGIPGDITTQAVNISNCGGQDLNWTITGVNAAWLQVSPLSGTNDASVDFTVNMTGLAPGNYSDTVTVTGAGADNSPQDIIVDITVIDTTPDADTVYVADVAITAGQQAVVNINYRNFITIGAISLPLNYTGTDIICDSVSFVGSRIAFMDQKSVEIDSTNSTILISAFSVSTADLNPGTGLMAKLYFSTDPLAATQTVPIDTGYIAPLGEYLFSDTDGAARATAFFDGSIDITGNPCFVFPVDTVKFTGYVDSSISPQSYMVTNECYGTLSWSVTDNGTWLEIAPTSGGANTNVEFSVNTAGLTENVYYANATFNSNAFGSPDVVVVKLTLIGVPVLALSDNAIDIGSVCQGDIVSGSFDISNAGTGTLNWTASADAGIDLSASSGTAPSSVDYDINTGGYGFGPQTVTIMVDGGTAQNSPQTLDISMNVLNCDECSFDIADVDGPQGFPVEVPVNAYQISNVAGLQFEFEYDAAVVSFDSVTTTYLTNFLYGTVGNQIFVVWDDIFNPLTIPNGNAILKLWFTTTGDVGNVGEIIWGEANEVVDPNGDVILGLGFCKGSVTSIEPNFDLAGQVVYYDLATPIENVDVGLTGPVPTSTTTDLSGNYLFAALPYGVYTVTPDYTADDAGVSVADVIKIRRHLAHLEEFTSGYKFIAADVNLSNTVSIADVVAIRRYLAALDTFVGGNWAFVWSGFHIDTYNWTTAPASHTVSLNTDIADENFVGIRLGDVNNTWAPGSPYAKNIIPGSRTVNLSINDMDVSAGETITVPVMISDVDEMAGVEIHLSFDPADLTFMDIKSDMLPGEVTVNGTSDAIHLVWDDFENPITVSNTQEIAEVTMRVNDNFDGNGEISFTGAEVANSEGLIYPVAMTSANLSGGGSSGLPTAYRLDQNTPNPFNPQTTIRAAIPVAGDYRLTIYNISGQKIRDYSGYSEAGIVEFVWDGRDGSGQVVSTGMYLYRFVSGNFAQTKKMVLLK